MLKRCAVYKGSSGYSEYAVRCIAFGISLPKTKVADPLYRHDLAVRYGWEFVSCVFICAPALAFFFPAFVLMFFGGNAWMALGVGGVFVSRFLAKRVYGEELDVCAALEVEFRG